MSRDLTAVMYHYVRDLDHSRYPQIKGRHRRDFANQLDYLAQNYQILAMEELIDFFASGRELPKRAMVLTFDDGYLDHYTEAVPILLQKGLPAAFYVPVFPLMREAPLDVNLVHLILAKTKDCSQLAASIFARLDALRSEADLPSEASLRAQYEHPNRVDAKEVILVKRLLQTGIPQPWRSQLCRDLFAEIVAVPFGTLMNELYLNREQVETMAKLGFHIGGHGYAHEWLTAMTPEEQRRDLTASKDFFVSLKLTQTHWTFCYPYGAYNETSVEILRDLDCKAAFTTEFSVARLNEHNPMLLPRLDTVDFPITARLS